MDGLAPLPLTVSSTFCGVPVLLVNTTSTGRPLPAWACRPAWSGGYWMTAVNGAVTVPTVTVAGTSVVDRPYPATMPVNVRGPSTVGAAKVPTYVPRPDAGQPACPALVTGTWCCVRPSPVTVTPT